MSKLSWQKSNFQTSGLGGCVGSSFSLLVRSAWWVSQQIRGFQNCDFWRFVLGFCWGYHEGESESDTTNCRNGWSNRQTLNRMTNRHRFCRRGLSFWRLQMILRSDPESNRQPLDHDLIYLDCFGIQAVMWNQKGRSDPIWSTTLLLAACPWFNSVDHSWFYMIQCKEWESVFIVNAKYESSITSGSETPESNMFAVRESSVALQTKPIGSIIILNCTTTTQKCSPLMIGPIAQTFSYTSSHPHQHWTVLVLQPWCKSNSNSFKQVVCVSVDVGACKGFHSPY